MSATWRKERSTVETNEIMKTAAHWSESWCWSQVLSFLSHVLMLVLTQLVCGRPKCSIDLINNPNPVHGHTITQQYVYDGSCLITLIRRYSSFIWEGHNQSPCTQEEMNISVLIYQPLLLIRLINKVNIALCIVYHSLYYDVSAAMSVLVF
jgi:hypothetical protein